MKKDQYFPLEVNFMNDEHVSDMMFELDSPQSLGVYIILLQHLRKADDYAASYKPLSLDIIAYTYRIDRQMLGKIIRDYELFELDEEHLTFRSPYLNRVMKRFDERMKTSPENGKKGGRPKKKIKPSETPMDKGEKPNEKQEKREEERRSITTVFNNSSNTAKPEVSAAAVVAAVAVEISSEGEKVQRPLQPVQHLKAQAWLYSRKGEMLTLWASTAPVYPPVIPGQSFRQPWVASSPALGCKPLIRRLPEQNPWACSSLRNAFWASG